MYNKEMLKTIESETLILTAADAFQRQLSVCVVEGKVVEELFLSNQDYIQKQNEIVHSCIQELRDRGE